MRNKSETETESEPEDPHLFSCTPYIKTYKIKIYLLYFVYTPLYKVPSIHLFEVQGIFICLNNKCHIVRNKPQRGFKLH